MITSETAEELAKAVRAADESTAIVIAQRYLDDAFEAGVSEILTTDPPKDGRPE
jgi:hypothetical protein